MAGGDPERPTLRVITGPTAAGKSAAAAVKLEPKPMTEKREAMEKVTQSLLQQETLSREEFVALMQ